jgi:hydrogenase-1 operon protein HyaE
MPSPLIQRLTAELGYPVLDEHALDAFLAAQRHSLLFFTEDPARYPESNDVAVVLPELMQVFGQGCAAAVIDRAAEKALQRRFGFNAWPALVVMRGSGYLGAITRVQDWRVYLEELDALFDGAVQRPPGIGVPLVEEPAGGCRREGVSP